VNFAGQLAAQYERDLDNATEIVLAPRRYRRSEPVPMGDPPRARVARGSGSSSRAAAGALRVANSVGAALTNHRVLGDAPSGPLLTTTVLLGALAAIAFLRPAWIAWPVGVLASWAAINLSGLAWRRRARANQQRSD
jgi:cardiolipin synthase A/B